MEERDAIAQLPVVTKQSTELIVCDEDSKLGGAELLATLKDCKKAIEEARDERADPYKTKLEQIRDAARPFIEKLDENIKIVQEKLSAYNLHLLQEAQRLQAEANAKFAADRKAAAEAAAATGSIPVPVAPPPVIQAPVKKITTTDGGTLAPTKVKKWTIPDYVVGEDLSAITRADPRLKALPNELFVFDAGRMTRHVKSVGIVGQPVPDAPGIIVYEEETFTRRKGKGDK